jgi:hypothetical protein
MVAADGRSPRRRPGLRDGVQQHEVTDVSMKPYRCGPEPRLDQLVGIRFTSSRSTSNSPLITSAGAAPWLLYHRLQWRGGGLLPRGLRRGRYWFQNHFMASPGEEMPGGEELVGWGIEPGVGHRVVTKGRHALSACCSLNTIAILTTLSRSKRFCSPQFRTSA